MDSLATSKEIAEFLGVHPQTMDRWASQDAGPPYYKIEGMRRYDWEGVRAWLKARSVVPGKALGGGAK